MVARFRHQMQRTVKEFLREYGDVTLIKFVTRLSDFMEQMVPLIREQAPNKTTVYSSPHLTKQSMYVTTDLEHVKEIAMVFSFRTGTDFMAPMTPFVDIPTTRGFTWTEGVYYMTPSSILGYTEELPLKEYNPLKFPVVENTPLIVLLAAACQMTGIKLHILDHEHDMGMVPVEEAVTMLLPRKITNPRNTQETSTANDMLALCRIVQQVYVSEPLAKRSVVSAMRGAYAFMNSNPSRQKYAIRVARFTGGYSRVTTIPSHVLMPQEASLTLRVSRTATIHFRMNEGSIRAKSIEFDNGRSARVAQGGHELVWN